MTLNYRPGTETQRAASTTVHPAQTLVVTDAGNIYVGDGVTQAKNLVRAVRLTEIMQAGDLGDSSGWNFAAMFANREVGFGQLADGSFYPTAKVESDLAALKVDTESTGWRWAIRYTSGEVAIGERTDGTYYPTSLAGPGGTKIVQEGDSLTANWGSSVAALVTLLGGAAQVINTGIGGQTSFPISARNGGQPATVVVTGGVIPASGSVTVTLNGRLRSDITVATNVEIQGVAGSFITTDSTNYLIGTFTRASAGCVVPVPDGTPMHTGFVYRGYWPLIWVGRNDYGQLPGASMVSNCVANIQAMLNWHTDDARAHAVVMSIPPFAGEGSGTGNRTTLDGLNAGLRAAFPTQYLDVSAQLRNAAVMSFYGYTPTAQDLTDIGNGLTPSQLRTAADLVTVDTGHWGPKGYDIANHVVANTYKARGWI